MPAWRGPRPALLRDIRLPLPRRRPREGGLGLAPYAIYLSLLPLALFLLPFFSASGECCGVSSLPPLAIARRACEIADTAPIVTVRRDRLTLNGGGLGERSTELAELRRGLSVLQNSERILRPQLPPAGRVYLVVDKSIPFGVLRPVLQTCIAAGYPTLSLVVAKSDW